MPLFLGMRVETHRSYRESQGDFRAMTARKATYMPADKPWTSRCGVLFGKRANPVNALNYALSRLDRLRAS